MYGVIITRDEMYDDAEDGFVYSPVSFEIVMVGGESEDSFDFVGSTYYECEAWVAKNYPYLV
jgi:hypothetical protein